jgi:RNA polymerase sigma-70 factor (ECF subfamily)
VTSNLAPGTDARSIQRSLAEPEAFTEVFDRHFDAVHGYVSRRLGRDLADELAAEVFTRAFDLRRRYDQSRPDARPWLLGIASNLVRRHRRTELRRLVAYARAVSPDEEPAPAGPETQVAAALAALPARDREALLLFAWADLTYEEIAAALGVPVGTVRSRIARARSRLRRALEVDGGPMPVNATASEGNHV